MKKILIFIRSFNDFDQALPIIEYICKNTKHKVFVWCFEENLTGCHYHISFLKNRLGLKVYFLNEKVSKLTKFIQNIYSSILNVSSKSKKYSALLPLTILFSKCRFIFNFFYRVGYSNLLKRHSFDFILMDTGMDSTIHGQNILIAAEEQKIITIGYAHGYSIYSNFNSVQKGKITHGIIKSFILKHAKPKITRTKYAGLYLTGFGQVSAQFKKSHASGYFDQRELGRVKEIGMPRYTSYWNQQYKNEILKNEIFSFGEINKLNVVLFMSHPQYNVHVENLYALIDSLSNQSNINFVYKPHTRRGLDLINTKLLKGFNASHVSSVLLSDWADVGIVYGSSIGFQMLIDRVPIVIPRFVHSNKTIFEKPGLSINVDSINQFNKLICKTKIEIEKMVDQKKIDDFILETIYGNNADNMMESYCSFLNE
jgi:hypothetical protein